MLKRGICSALCALVCISSLATAQTRRKPSKRVAQTRGASTSEMAPPPPPVIQTPQTPPATSTAPVAEFDEARLKGDLAALFPENTTVYAELLDPASMDKDGTLDQIYAAMAEPSSSSGKNSQAPIPTIDEIRTMLKCDFAVGLQLSRGFVGATSFLAVVRSPSREASDLIQNKLLPLFFATSPTAKFARTTVRGRELVLLSPEGQSDKMAYATVGDSLVIGSLDRVVGLLTEPKAEKSLATSPAYKDARERLSSRTDSLIYLAVGEIVDTTLFSPPGVPVEQTPWQKAMTEIGVRAIRAFASGADTSSNSGETLLEIDRSHETLLSVLSDAPPVNLRATSVLPANLHAVVSFGVDAGRLLDFQRRHFPPDVARSVGMPTADAAAQMIEAGTGLKPDELVAAFGDEVTFGWDFTALIEDLSAAAASPQKQSPSTSWPRPLVAVEVRQPEVARGALARLLGAAEAGTDGVAVAPGGTAFAILGEYAVVGSPADVRRAVEAQKTGDTLAASQPFVASLNKLDASTVASVYVSPKVAEAYLKALQSSGLPGPAIQPHTGPVLVAVDKESLGLYMSSSSTGTAAVPLAGIIAAIAIPSLLKARKAANEAAAIGNLRTIASAEATYIAGHGRYATLQQLIAAKYLDETMTDGSVHDNYRIAQRGITKNAFEFAAEPLSPTSGDKAFNVMEDYVIRYTVNAPAPKRTEGTPIGKSPTPAGK
jgi:type II secretory pathway pseudopilin PulG